MRFLRQGPAQRTSHTYMVSTVLVARLLASIWLALDWCLQTSLCYRYRFRLFKASIEAFVRFWVLVELLELVLNVSVSDVCCCV